MGIAVVPGVTTAPVEHRILAGVLIKNATLVAWDPPLVERADIRVQADRIVERGATLASIEGEEEVDLSGRLILPGQVNAHTHLYSTFARGWPGPTPPPRKFLEILESVWWRLDRALDEESIHLSALVGGIEAALSGTTVLLDHHSSPSFIHGSLDLLRRALEEVGVRSVLCYEVTDRNGLADRDRGIEENLGFQKAHRTGLTRGMMGAHASFTLSDESLERLSDAVRRSGTSLHLHAAEDRADVEDCRKRHFLSIPERLIRHDLIISRTILAHGVHLSPADIENVHAHGGWIVHNPRSNMNNSVGHAPSAALKRGALGTDGLGHDLFAEAHAAYLKMRDTGHRRAAEPVVRLLAGGHRLAAALFGLPFGKLDVGGPADLVVLDYPTPTPIETASLAGHLLFGMDRSHVESVLVAGRWIVRDGVVTGVDVEAAYARARQAARALWQRIESLPAAASDGKKGA